MKKRTRVWWILSGALVGVVVLLGATYYLWPTSAPALRAESRPDCWGVGSCADDCSQRCPNDLKKYQCMLDCKSRCEQRGCGGAAARHDRLASCVKRRCLLRCIGGPSADCKRCTRSRCKADSEACLAHRCPDGRK